MVRFFNALGAPLLSFCQYLGELVLLAGETFRSIFTHKLRWKLFLNQVVEIGLLSQVLVIITGGFTGAVFSIQQTGNGLGCWRGCFGIAVPGAGAGVDGANGCRTRRGSDVG